MKTQAPQGVVPGSTRDPLVARGSRLKAGTTALFLALVPILSFAQTSPVGLWRNIDDKTGEAKAEIRIVDNGGVLSGRIEKTLKKDAKPTCEECKDDRKGQPIVGLEIIRGAHQADDKGEWDGGKILDPENGREYTLRLKTIDGGQKLRVRGYLGPFYRTQTWVRVQ